MPNKQSPSSPAKKAGRIKPLFGIVALVFVVAAVVLGVLNNIEFASVSERVFWTALAVAVVTAPLLEGLFLRPARRGEYGSLAAPDISAANVTDSLTQLMNRRAITMGMLEAMAQAGRYNTPLSIALVDVDGFQRVNSEHGNTNGDKVLAELAGVLAETLRMPDKIGRFDGEEFLAVLPHTGLTQAKKIADRLRANAAGAKFNAQGKRVALTVSAGVTQFSKGDDLEQLLSRAHAAVKEAKLNSGNRVVARKSAR